MKNNQTSIDASKALECILAQKSVSFYPIFAKAFGSVPAAVMLSQGMFWQHKAKHGKHVIIKGEAYFSKTVAEWYEETSISESAQKLARTILVKHGVFKEVLAGLPATMHFRIDLDSVVAVINGYLLTGVSVAVKHGNRKRSLTRTASGKFRQQEAVKDGSIIIESSDSYESVRERDAPAKNQSNLKAEKETPPPVAPPPPADFQPVAIASTPSTSLLDAEKQITSWVLGEGLETVKYRHETAGLRFAPESAPALVAHYVSIYASTNEASKASLLRDPIAHFQAGLFKYLKNQLSFERSGPANNGPQRIGVQQSLTVVPRSLQNQIGK